MLRLFLIRRITGGSMLPTMLPGSIVVGVTMFRRRGLQIGQVVMLGHNKLEKVKRITDVRTHDGRRQLYVRGDNEGHSTDSRQFGWLDTAAVIAIIVWPRQTALRILDK